MKFTVITSVGKVRVKDGGYEVGDAGVLTVRSDGKVVVLSPHAWLRIDHDDVQPAPQAG